MRSLLAAALVPALVAAACVKKPVDGAPFTCPMHLNYVLDRPGDCPICGMDLVPQRELVASSSGDGGAPAAHPGAPHGATPRAAVTLDPEHRRLIGLRTARVTRGPLASEIRTVGRVAFDERRVVKVQPRFEGFIETLHANFTGKLVRKGDPLALVYSPELLATQNELLLARKARGALEESGVADTAQAARTRLRLLGMSAAQIAAVEERGTPLATVELRAPASGYVVAKNAVEGARFGPEAPLFDLVDLTSVWVLADVYEFELPRLAAGQEARITLPFWPDREWRGRVGYVYPTVDEKSRTVRVRIEVPNPRAELKVDMFADVVLAAPPRSALLVPDDAVIDSGARKVVFLALGDGRLEPREIETGEATGGSREVRRGLAEGDEVAAGASFLLDSESRLRAALQALRTDAPPEGAR